MTDILHTAIAVFALVSEAAAIAFVVLYLVLFNPLNTTAGRLLLQLVISLGSLGLLSILRHLMGGLPDWVLWIDLAAWAFIMVTLVSLVIFLIVRRFWPYGGGLLLPPADFPFSGLSGKRKTKGTPDL